MATAKYKAKKDTGLTYRNIFHQGYMKIKGN